MRLKEFLQDGSNSNSAKNWDKLSLSQRKEYVNSFLQNKGYNKNQSAAVLGNLLQENSTLNTSTKNSIGALGIAQWMGDRKSKLLNEENPYSIVTQLNHLDNELRTNGWSGYNEHKNTFFQSNNLSDLTYAVRKGFERPEEHEANDARRLKYANEIAGSVYTDGSTGNQSGLSDNYQHADMSEYKSIIEDMHKGLWDYNKINEMYQKNPGFTTMMVDNVNKEADLAETQKLEQERLQQEQNKKIVEQKNQKIQNDLVEKQNEREQLLSMVPKSQSITYGDIQQQSMQEGGTVSDMWKNKTGLDWSEAKAKGYTDGSYSSNIKLLHSLQNNTQAEIPTEEKNIEEISMIAPKDIRVRQQQTLVKQGDYNNNKNYAIVDKGDNKIYYFGTDHNVKSAENIITGKDNLDSDRGLSMKQWYQIPENKDKTHEDYFKYLDDKNLQITPSGEFTIGEHRTNVTQNPSQLGRLINLFRPERAEQIEKSRTDAYGKKGELFTMVDTNGVPISKAIHGTNYENRVQALDQNNSDNRNLSNGCINIKGNSMCFDILEDGSKVFVMPEESKSLIKPKDKEKAIKYGSRLDSSSRYIEEVLNENNITNDKGLVNFITALREKESKSGTSKFSKYIEPLANQLDMVKSNGDFQINPDSEFSKYLPKNYDNSNIKDQIKAVVNFYNDHKKNLNPTEMYNLYNTGSSAKKSPYTKKFQEILDHVNIINN